MVKIIFNFVNKDLNIFKNVQKYVNEIFKGWCL